MLTALARPLQLLLFVQGYLAAQNLVSVDVRERAQEKKE